MTHPYSSYLFSLVPDSGKDLTLSYWPATTDETKANDFASSSKASPGWRIWAGGRSFRRQWVAITLAQLVADLLPSWPDRCTVWHCAALLGHRDRRWGHGGGRVRVRLPGGVVRQRDGLRWLPALVSLRTHVRLVARQPWAGASAAAHVGLHSRGTHHAPFPTLRLQPGGPHVCGQRNFTLRLQCG